MISHSKPPSAASKECLLTRATHSIMLKKSFPKNIFAWKKKKISVDCFSASVFLKNAAWIFPTGKYTVNIFQPVHRANDKLMIVEHQFRGAVSKIKPEFEDTSRTTVGGKRKTVVTILWVKQRLS